MRKENLTEEEPSKILKLLGGRLGLMDRGLLRQPGSPQFKSPYYLNYFSNQSTNRKNRMKGVKYLVG